jgi:citrate synthase
MEAALVAAVDHGPQAPSIATARMAVTCGLGLNGALASAVNMLDDVHGGAGEQAVELYGLIDAAAQARPLAEAVAAELDRWRAERANTFPASATAFTSRSIPARRGCWRW